MLKETDGMIEAQALSEQGFANLIAKIVGRTPIDISVRPLYASLSFSYHQRPNIVVIEAQGSPPRMTVMVSDLEESFRYRKVYVNGKRLSSRSHPHGGSGFEKSKLYRVCDVVDSFLRSPAFANCLARNGDAQASWDFRAAWFIPTI